MIHLDKVLSKLHSFPYLSDLTIRSVTIQSSHILRSIFRIRSLKSLSLLSWNPIFLNLELNSIEPCSHLEYLSIESCYLSEFVELLIYLGPSLRVLNLSLYYENPSASTVIDPLTIDEFLSNPNLPSNRMRSLISSMSLLCLECLQYLQIRFNYLSLTSFHSFLLLFPYLISLKFSALTHELDFLSASIWHSFISSHLLHLKKLQFYIKVCGKFPFLHS